MKEEIWEDIPGLDGLYKVSTKGLVKSLKNGCYIMKQTLDERGYYVVNINRTPRRIHQLVAMAFLNHKPNGHKMVVDHIDENQLNNELSNLQVIPHGENIRRSKTGKGKSKYVGVHMHSQTKKWVAQIQLKGKIKHLGCFNTEEEAHKAYQNEKKKTQMHIL